MKILLVSPSLRMGGSERVVSLLSQELSKHHQILLVLFNSQEIAYPYKGELIDLACPAQKSYWKKLSNFIKRVARLYLVIKGHQPELIISFMESANFPTIVASALSGNLSKTQISVHSNPKYFTLPQKLTMGITYRLPKRVIAVSRGIAQSLLSYRIPDNKIVYIPNPVSLEQISQLMEQAPPVLDKLPPNYILGVGRLHYSKGFDRLLKAFSQIKDANLHLVILGSGEERVNLIQLAEELEIRERVHFYNSVENPFPFYRKANCFVLSSRFEGFPLVILEAFVCGCPVISYDCDYGPSELIQNGINGILVKEGDIDGLTQAMDKLTHNQTLRQSFIKNGYEKIEQYDIQNIANQYLLT